MSSSKSTGAHGQLRVAVAGFGHWGPNVARDLAGCEGVEIAWIVDNDASALRRGAGDHRGADRSASLQECLGDVDAVAICTSAHTHVELALAALAAGLDVFLEKPMAMSLADARSLLDARGDSVLMVGHQMLYHPVFCQLADMVGRGDLGGLESIECERAGELDFTREPDVLWTYGPHDVAMTLTLAGRDPEEVNRITPSQPCGTAGEFASLEMNFGAGGPTARVTLDGVSAERKRLLRVACSEGVAIFDDGVPGGELTILDEAGEKTRLQIRGRDLHAPLKLECEHFVHCCKTREAPRADGALGLRVTSVLEMASGKVC